MQSLSNFRLELPLTRTDTLSRTTRYIEQMISWDNFMQEIIQEMNINIATFQLNLNCSLGLGTF